MDTLETSKTNHTRPAERDRIDRIEGLLRRYPALTDDELHEVLAFLRRGSVLEVGLLTGRDDIRSQLDRFRADHKRALSIGVRELAVIAIIVVALLAVAALLWDAGAG